MRWSSASRVRALLLWLRIPAVLAVALRLRARSGIDLVLKVDAFFVGDGVALLAWAALEVAVPLIAWRRAARAAPAPAPEPVPLA